MLPVFVGEYVYGQKLLNDKTDAFNGRGKGISDTDRGLHGFFAGSVAAHWGSCAMPPPCQATGGDARRRAGPVSAGGRRDARRLTHGGA